VTDASVFVTPIPFADGVIDDLTWGQWQTSDANVLDANSFSAGDLLIFEGFKRGIYEVKLQVAFVFDATPDSVTIVFYTESVGGGTTGSMNTYFEQLGHAATPDLGHAWVYRTTVDVPPFDPEATAIDPDDPPTGFVGYAQARVDGSDADLKWSRLEVYYRGPLPSFPAS
jgi:hypothetical protein